HLDPVPAARGHGRPGVGAGRPLLDGRVERERIRGSRSRESSVVLRSGRPGRALRALDQPDRRTVCGDGELQRVPGRGARARPPADAVRGSADPMRSRSGGRMRGRSAGPAGGHRAVAALAMMIAWGVTGGCGEAVPPPLMVADASATRPTLALAPDGGGAWVAWVSDGASSDVWVRHVAADGTADPAPVRVNDVPGDAAPHGQAPARVAAGPEGHVYVTWQNNQIVEGRAFPASDLRFARSTDGGRTFEPAIFVNDDAGGPAASHTFHDMVVGPDGTVIVSWIDGRRALSDPDIRLAASRDGGASFGS